MKNIRFCFAVVAVVAAVGCGSDDGKDDSMTPSPSDPGVQPAGAPGQGIERSRPQTISGAADQGAGGAAPAAAPNAGGAGTNPAPATNPAPSTNPPPAVNPPAATNPPPATNPPATTTPPPATNPPPDSSMNGADAACEGKAEGDLCGPAACQSETHTVQGHCDKNLACVQVKVKCDKSCEGGVCVDAKPGNGNNASGGKT